MEEHLLDIQDGASRGGVRSNNNVARTFAKKKTKKKLKSSRFSPTRRPKTATSVPFVPTKRPPVRARRPKVLSKPAVNNNLGQTLIPPQSVKSGDSVVNDYADYEYIYFYDDYDQETKIENIKKKKTKTHRQEEMRKQNGVKKQLETQQKVAKEEKRQKEKERRERKRKEGEKLRQAQLKLRQQETMAQEELKERRKQKEQEMRRKKQQERQLQETRRLELGRRLEEEQARLRTQQSSTSDNSKQNKQFAQRQQKLFRGHSFKAHNSQQITKQSKSEKAQESRRPKVLQGQTPRFQNRPAPVTPEKSIKKPELPQNKDAFIVQTESSIDALERPIKKPNLLQNNNSFRSRPQRPVQTTVTRNKSPRKQNGKRKGNRGRNRGRNFKQTQNRGTNFKFNSASTTTPVPSRSIGVTSTLPKTSNFVSTLVSPQGKPPTTSTFSTFQKRPRPKQQNQRRPNLKTQHRKPKLIGAPVEPRIIPIANVKPPNAKPKANAIQARKNRNKGGSSKSSSQRNRNNGGK